MKMKVFWKAKKRNVPRSRKMSTVPNVADLSSEMRGREINTLWVYRCQSVSDGVSN